MPSTTGPAKDPLANFLRIWQKNSSQDSSSYPPPPLDTTRTLPPGNIVTTKPVTKNTDSLSDKNNKASLKQEIAKEKAEIVDSLGKLEMGLEEALDETRGNVPKPTPENNLDNSQRFQVQVPNPGPLSFQMAEDKSSNPSDEQYNPTINTLTNAENPNPQVISNTPNVTPVLQTPGLVTNAMVNSYNAGPSRPQEQPLPYLSNVNINQPKANDEFHRLVPNPIANELTSNANLQTQSLRFNQVANKPVNNGLNLVLYAVDNQRRNNTEFDDGNPLTSQPPYNNDFNLPNMPSPNQPYVNPGEMTQSYVGNPPLSPPLEHAYPLSHEHEALLPPLNHQQLPPLNHNNLVATETSRYTGSDPSAIASQGKTYQFDCQINWPDSHSSIQSILINIQ